MIKTPKAFSFIFFLAACFYYGPATAQYYYKDIWNNQQLIKEFAILKTDKLKTIKIKSFEDDGEPSQGFFCEKKINKGYTQSQMISKSYITGQSLLVSDYDAGGRPVKSLDDTPTTTSTTEYEYDAKGKLTLIRTNTKADDDSGQITETHEYSYDEKGLPLKMLRKKNDILRATISFVNDANGNTIEEDVEGDSRSEKKYYYYYDTHNRLTDVVHYNAIAKRLLPSYMYEYNAQNLPKQMISTEEGGSNYFIWKYTYNDNNLRETEKCFSKERRLLGTIQYEYK
jgi:YD repeat-containing protein